MPPENREAVSLSPKPTLPWRHRSARVAGPRDLVRVTKAGGWGEPRDGLTRITIRSPSKALSARQPTGYPYQLVCCQAPDSAAYRRVSGVKVGRGRYPVHPERRRVPYPGMTRGGHEGKWMPRTDAQPASRLNPLSSLRHANRARFFGLWRREGRGVCFFVSPAWSTASPIGPSDPTRYLSHGGV